MPNLSIKKIEYLNSTRSVVDLTHQLNSIETLAARIISRTEDLDDLRRGGNNKMFKNAIIEEVENIVQIKNVGVKSVLSLVPYGNSEYIHRSILSEDLLPDYCTNKETIVRHRAQCYIRPDRRQKCRSNASDVIPVSLPPPAKGLCFLFKVESGKDRFSFMAEWIDFFCSS